MAGGRARRARCTAASLFMGDDSADDSLIAALQKRLHTSGPLPKREAVCAAVAMRRDETLSIAAACDSQEPKVPRGSRDRVKQYCKKIKDEGLLVACAAELARPSTQARKYGPYPQPWHHAYPKLKPPRCPHCKTSCMLEMVMDVSLDYICDVCGADLPGNNVYWFSQCRKECEEQHGNYDLCHACTDSSAQVDWTSPVVLGTPTTRACWGAQRGCPGWWAELARPEGYWDELRIYGKLDDADTRTALSLNLPTTRPFLLTPKEWVARNAPNIWVLHCGPLRIAEDGKSVSRELIAALKIRSDEQRAEYDAAEYDGEWSWDEEVTYEYPPTAEQCRKELFVRERHIEKMRQREKAAILRLDGEAELNHRERKVQLACDRRAR